MQQHTTRPAERPFMVTPTRVDRPPTRWRLAEYHGEADVDLLTFAAIAVWVLVAIVTH